jgi:acyl dehydratase
MSPTNYITDEVKQLIGRETDWVEACDPVEQGAIRRFHQAVMDDDPIFWKQAEAAGTRYGGVVAPPLFPLHAFRRPSGAPDPLNRVSGDPDFDGVTRDFGLGLPPVPIALPRLLNGGNQVEVHALAHPGDRIRAKSKYVDIYQKDGKSGVLIFILVETIYADHKGNTLLKALQTHILR